jgi:hypothetical protein
MGGPRNPIGEASDKRMEWRPSKPNRPDLIEAWTALKGSPPPKGLSTRMLAIAVAYDAQVKQHGGLSPSLRKRLVAFAGQANKSANRSSTMRQAKLVNPGTRLVREWQGITHVVDVHNGHIAYDGKSFKSLSAVARAITGARWSGPRFFGLTAT